MPAAEIRRGGVRARNRRAGCSLGDVLLPPAPLPPAATMHQAQGVLARDCITPQTGVQLQGAARVPEELLGGSALGQPSEKSPARVPTALCPGPAPDRPGGLYLSLPCPPPGFALGENSSQGCA